MKLIFLLMCVWMAGGDAMSHHARLLLHSRARASKEGPNMCTVQQVSGTDKKYYSSCKSWYRKTICKKPTTVSYECCPGYITIGGQRGCPAVSPLTGLYSSLEPLGATTTKDYSERAGLQEQLDGPGTVTFFVPSNDAWNELPRRQRNELERNGRLGLSNKLQYHMVNQRLMASDLKDGDVLPTLHDNQKVLINHYKNGIVTVNCVRVIKANNLATNGVVHMLDGILTEPARTLRKILDENKELSTLKSAIIGAGMMSDLEEEQGLTLLAPTNAAFKKLPDDVLKRILSDPISLKALLNNHMVNSMHCAEAVIGNTLVETKEGKQMVLGCNGDSLTINGKPIVDKKDLVAKNGVVHTISDVMIPDSARTALELAKSSGAKKFVDMFAEAGIGDAIKADEKHTFLAPSDDSFKDTPMDELSPNLKFVLKNHILKKKVSIYQLYNGQKLENVNGKKLRVFMYRKSICIENSCVSKKGMETRTGQLYIVKNLIRIPEKTLMDDLEEKKEFSTLIELLRLTGLDRKLSDPSGSYTLFAPTNKAFLALGRRKLNQLKANPKELEAFLRFHLSRGVIVRGGVNSGLTNILKTLHGSTVHLTSKDGHFVIDKTKVMESDLMSTNGVIHVIDTPLTPKGKPDFVSEIDKSTIPLPGTKKTSIITSGIRPSITRVVIVKKTITNPDGSPSIQTFRIEGDNIEEQLRRIAMEGRSRSVKIMVEGNLDIPNEIRRLIEQGGGQYSKVAKVFPDVTYFGSTVVTVKITTVNADGTTREETHRLEGDDIEERLQRLTRRGQTNIKRIAIEGEGHLSAELQRIIESSAAYYSQITRVLPRNPAMGSHVLTVNKRIMNRDGTTREQTYRLEGADIEQQLRRIKEEGQQGTLHIRVEGEGELPEALRRLIESIGEDYVQTSSDNHSFLGGRKATVKKTVKNPDGTYSTRTFTLEGDDIDEQIRRLSESRQ
uniref:transforming growth factor-beta-induced protein ig-h3-like n=1 Tax=Myxine glutinosa TaxID=7769 RepID=UPI00358FA073